MSNSSERELERLRELVERYRADAQAVATIRRSGGSVVMDGVRIEAATIERIGACSVMGPFCKKQPNAVNVDGLDAR